jgi:hypothetical protein
MLDILVPGHRYYQELPNNATLSKLYDSERTLAYLQLNTQVEVVIECKTLPRWFAGRRALDGGCCEQKVSRYCRYVYQYVKIGPSEDPDRKEGKMKWLYGYRSQYKTVKEVL